MRVYKSVSNPERFNRENLEIVKKRLSLKGTFEVENQPGALRELQREYLLSTFCLGIELCESCYWKQ